MTNFDLSDQVFYFLKQAGVKSVIVCAGARNAPLVLALEQHVDTFEVFQFFEERSAAFFALGLVKAQSRPVAIIMTSGTAVAEVLPATIEAHYQGLPLIIVSADRPQNYRGTGAPQSIEQLEIFSGYVESVHDLNVHHKLEKIIWSQTKPLHLNICFDEPLIDYPSVDQQSVAEPFEDRLAINFQFTPTIEKLNNQNISLQHLADFQQPLIIVGALESDQKEPVVEFILKNQLPVYAESLSQIRADVRVQKFLLEANDVFIENQFKNQTLQSVIRIGGVPTLRFWRDLEKKFQHIPVINITHLPFTGLARSSHIKNFSILKKIAFNFSYEIFALLLTQSENLKIEKQKLLKKYPQSEPALMSCLSQLINKRPVYLGNSLPIREWDQFADAKSEEICANRGANGIDGQISTYLGYSQKHFESFCLVGDLTALYDLASLGLSSQLQNNFRHIVVMNNFGGQIFNRIFKNKSVFTNPHKIEFKNWAQMWGWAYIKVTQPEEIMQLESTSEFIESKNSQFNQIVEIQPNLVQTEFFWKEWDQICQKI